ncbi:MAG: TonB-dependent receptor [Pseudomonadota bacterium]|nr:TonB-dependent receptor [Pseudomonadota bacterium]
MQKIFCCLLIVFASNVYSQAKSQQIKAHSLETIQVKAVRSSANIYQTGSSIDVITSDEIFNKGYSFVSEALESLGGINVSQSGAFGGTSYARIRGASSGQTLVLIDGVKVNDASSPDGAFDFSNLQTFNIERIEVLKGSQSTLWGSDAIGGLINIVTKDFQMGPKYNFFIETGSHETLKLGANIYFSNNENNFQISAFEHKSKGISKAEENDGNFEKDGFGSRSFLFKGKLNFYDITYSTNINYSESDIDFDSYGFITGVKDGDENTKSNHLNWTMSVKKSVLEGKLDSILTYARSSIDRKYSLNGRQNFSAEGKRDFIRYTGNYSFSPTNFLTFGLEKEETKVLTDSISTKSLFLLYELKPLKKLGISLGLRSDRKNNDSKKNTMKITGFYDLGNDWFFRSNWGEGFKLPTIFQSTFFCCGAVTANKSIKPESSEGYEVGFEYTSKDKGVTFGITYFNQDIINQIDFSFALGVYENIKRVSTEGFELNLGYNKSENFNISGSYSFLEAKDSLGVSLIRIPKSKASIDFSYTISSDSRFFFQINYNGREKDTRVTLEEWIRADLTFIQNLKNDLVFFTKIKNIFNESYQDIYGYGTEGTSVYLGVKVNY